MSDIYPAATLLEGVDWPLNDQRRQRVRAVTVHTTQGRNSVGLGQSRHHDTPGTFNFLISRDGGVWQFYPANVRCSHAAGANRAGPGIEIEGFTGEPLTDQQLGSLGRLANWLVVTYGIPLRYRTGDPREYIDNSSYTGFVAHRAVDYPPDKSMRHFDEITPEEWAQAVGLPPSPLSLPKKDRKRMFTMITEDGITVYLAWSLPTGTHGKVAMDAADVGPATTAGIPLVRIRNHANFTTVYNAF